MTKTECIQNNSQLRNYNTLSTRIEKLEHLNSRHGKLHIQNLIITLKKELELIDSHYAGSNNFNKTSSPSKIQRIKSIEKYIKSLEPIETHWLKLGGCPHKLEPYTENRKLIKSSINSIIEKNKKTLKYEKQWRLTHHLKWAIQKKRYIIFDTLTVNPESMDLIFSPGSKIWKNYITKFRRLIGIEKYGNKKIADQMWKVDKYHAYFAVTEHGSKTGRTHLHVIHTMDCIPESWKQDPNKYGKLPINRLVNGPQKHWEYGFSYPVAVRINEFDSWGNLNWRWPVKKTGSPVDPTDSRFLSAYMAKYITKGDLLCQKLKTWRTKISRHLGLEMLTLTIKKTKTQDLKPIYKTHLITKIHNQVVPKRLIRKQIIKEVMTRLKKRYSKTTLYTILRTVKSQEGLLRHLKIMTQTNSNLNFLTSGFSMTRKSRSTAFSNFQLNLEINCKKHLIPDTIFTTKGVSWK